MPTLSEAGGTSSSAVLFVVTDYDAVWSTQRLHSDLAAIVGSISTGGSDAPTSIDGPADVVALLLRASTMLRPTFTLADDALHGRLGPVELHFAPIRAPAAARAALLATLVDDYFAAIAARRSLEAALAVRTAPAHAHVAPQAFGPGAGGGRRTKRGGGPAVAVLPLKRAGAPLSISAAASRRRPPSP